ncbi:FAD-dependent monooxygenase [Bacillus mesophilus]|uniref:FAD-dependent monooxygenase n=1 Tax=Bacillus mesophilus TaxID=1808955 RepID=A0A6M0QCH5_9BACI|nr:FAD-dependent monooxygenase [Bacillus mesophilus]
MLGYKLAQHGIKVCVIEQTAKQSHAYKGELLQPKSLLILRDLGLLSRIEREGKKIYNIEFVELDEHQETLFNMNVSYDQLSPSINYSLMIPHEKLKDYIRQEAMKFENFFYISPARLQRYEHGKAIVKKEKEEVEISAEYFIGAEGRKSPTRDELGLKPKKYLYNHQFLTVTIPRPSELTNGKIITTPHKFLGLFPLPNQLVRTVFLINRGEYPLYKERGLDDLRDQYNELAPELKPYTPALNSWSKIQLMDPISYHVEKYGEEELTLIGDAAHTVHPIAGQGMNLAMQDADIVGELLYSIFKSRDSQITLKDYEKVRRERNKYILRMSKQSAYLYSFRNKYFQSLRIRGMKNLKRDPKLHFKQMLNISGLGLWKLSFVDYLVQAGLIPAREIPLSSINGKRYFFNEKTDYPWKYEGGRSC